MIRCSEPLVYLIVTRVKFENKYVGVVPVGMVNMFIRRDLSKTQPDSQYAPVHSLGQIQVIELPESAHVPPFWHGSLPIHRPRSV